MITTVQIEILYIFVIDQNKLSSFLYYNLCNFKVLM